jgi:hypothetical protein
MPFNERFADIVWAMLVTGIVTACVYDYFFRKESA